MVLLVVYFLVFFGLALRQFNIFGRDQSLYAEYDSMFWWTLQGKLFLMSGYGLSEFAMHTSYFWVLLLPFYWLAPGVPTLLFFQTLALTLAAWPFFLLVRRVLEDDWAGWWAAAAYLFLPALVSQNLNQIQETVFVAPFLMAAMYFFVARHWRWFLVFGGLTCLVRENFPLAVAMFGVWAWREKRDWKWVVVPLVGGSLYFALVTFVIMPAMRAGHAWHVTNRYFDYLGDSPGQMIATVLQDPLILVRHLLQADVLMFLVLLTQTFGFVLPFVSLPVLIALPDLLVNLFTGANQMRVIAYHYHVATSSALAVATVFTFRKLQDRCRRQFGGTGGYARLLAAGLLVVAVAQWMLWLDVGRFRQLPHHETLVRALQVVPKDASVLVPRRMLGHVSQRAKWDVNGLFWDPIRKAEPREIPPEYPYTFEYVIFDANERQYPPFFTRETFEQFSKNPAYRVIFAENNVFVFQRVATSPVR